jgi:hypothetical protein
MLVLILVAGLAAVAAFVLVRRPGGTGSAAHTPAIRPAADALLPGSPVLLSSKAAIIADRYNCLCGDCSDTLGKCTCARDKGSNEMKATLNQLAAEKKALAEIDAAMVGKYGPKVLVSADSAGR